MSSRTLAPEISDRLVELALSLLARAPLPDLRLQLKQVLRTNERELSTSGITARPGVIEAFFWDHIRRVAHAEQRNAAAVLWIITKKNEGDTRREQELLTAYFDLPSNERVAWSDALNSAEYADALRPGLSDAIVELFETAKSLP